MRILVVGGDSTIGSALAAHAAVGGGQVLVTTRRAAGASSGRIVCDLRDVSTLPVDGRATDVAYLCAGVTSLDACRRAPDDTRAINVAGVVSLATRLRREGIFTVFLSTNLVFDGGRPCRRVDEAVCPATEYGRQKAEAERALLALGDLVAVVRLTKVVSPSTPLFRGWAAALHAGQAVRPFRDMVMAPVALHAVVDVLAEIGRRRLGGIHQMSGDVDVSYADAAHRFAVALGADATLVQPTTAQEAGIPVEAVVRHTTLDTGGLHARLGRPAPSTAECLDDLAGKLAESLEASHA